MWTAVPNAKRQDHFMDKPRVILFRQQEKGFSLKVVSLQKAARSSWKAPGELCHDSWKLLLSSDRQTTIPRGKISNTEPREIHSIISYASVKNRRAYKI